MEEPIQIPYTCDEVPFGQPDKKIKMLGYCVKGNNKINTLKKEKTFIDILESLTEEDASIVCLAKMVRL